MRILAKLFVNQRGASAIEYAVIASLISVAAITGYSNLGSEVGSSFTEVDQTLGNAI